MLKKLLKYEIKATGRIFLPMYALLIVLALINKFFYSVNVDYLAIPQILTMTAFVAIIVGIFLMTLVVTIQRFNKNLLTDEGYLSFTLPVQAHSHINCKMITTLMWLILSGIVSFISIFIMTINRETIDSFKNFFSLMGSALAIAGIDGYIIFFEVIFLCIFGLLSEILSIYAAITIGNMSSKHKLLAGIGSYLGMGLIEQFFATILITSYNGKIGTDFQLFGNYSAINQYRQAQTILLLLIVFVLVFGTAYYILTNWMLNNKLNLE